MIFPTNNHPESAILPRKVIVLSGPVCSGKTTLAKQLAERFQAHHLRTSDCILAARPNVKREREAMQLAGEALDREYRGQWVLKAFQSIEGIDGDNHVIVLDSARIQDQIDAVKNAYGNRVIHIHLTAPAGVLSTRYKDRHADDFQELKSYQDVLKNKTEADVPKLAHTADIEISTDRSDPEGVLLRAASHAGLFGKDYGRLVDVIVGGQFGSEGKGQVSAFLAPEYDALLRVGGPNAGHTVSEAAGSYTFHHLPSGTRANTHALILLAPGAVARKTQLLNEIAECNLEYDRLVIDPQVRLISDEEVAAEAELQKAMGSTGQGVGQATARRILERDSPRRLCNIAENDKDLKPYVHQVIDRLDLLFARGNRVFLEGTQGTGLSLYHGMYPYVTSRDTTVAGCLAEAGISPSRVRKVIMTCRTYPIRVESPAGGTSGAMTNEIDWKVVSKRSGIPLEELDAAERTSTTNRKRRVGEFDWSQLRRSASLNAPTDIALTFMDYLDKGNRDARRVEQLAGPTLQFVEEVERISMAPVSLMSVRFHSRGIIDRRRW
jgi:adenylosuccinate synthase